MKDVHLWPQLPVFDFDPSCSIDLLQSLQLLLVADIPLIYYKRYLVLDYQFSFIQLVFYFTVSGRQQTWDFLNNKRKGTSTKECSFCFICYTKSRKYSFCYMVKLSYAFFSRFRSKDSTFLLRSLLHRTRSAWGLYPSVAAVSQLSIKEPRHSLTTFGWLSIRSWVGLQHFEQDYSSPSVQWPLPFLLLFAIPPFAKADAGFGYWVLAVFQLPLTSFYYIQPQNKQNNPSLSQIIHSMFSTWNPFSFFSASTLNLCAVCSASLMV